jgi:peptidoglycan hydrolase-like protein with peptidoglycan-binding domain
MAVLKFVDATSPGDITGGPFDGTAFYIGGDAYRVWEHSEIVAIDTKYKLPIWVRSNPTSTDAPNDVLMCVAALKAIDAPDGALVALDSETAVDPTYTVAFVDGMNKSGYRVMDYGSQDKVFGNKNPDGYYWGADWTDVPHLAKGDGATQYVSLKSEDESDVASTLPLWGGTLTPVEPVAPAVTVALHLVLPELQAGALDLSGTVWFVHKLQALLKQVGMAASLAAAENLADDGDFGADTTAALKAVQGHFGLTEDGIVGLNTWTALLLR